MDKKSEIENNRSDSEIIRKAVELADGWQYQEKWFAYIPGLTDGVGEPSQSLDEQFVLDALAAQLVRQVDALDWSDFESQPTWCALFTKGDRVSLKSGPDRTMNTLRAIVQSGVLDTPQMPDAT